jgi:multidrug efflux system membrane fusion protein
MARVHFDRLGTRRGTSFLALLVTLLPIVLLQACARTSAQPAAPAPPKVTTAEVLSREVTEYDEFTGRLEAVNTVAVRPRVSGYVSSVRFREGAIVKKGDLLFQIDPRPFQAEVDRLRAELVRLICRRK